MKLTMRQAERLYARAMRLRARDGLLALNVAVAASANAKDPQRAVESLRNALQEITEA